MGEAGSGQVRSRDVLLNLIRRVAPHDFAGTVIVCALWTSIGLGDWRVLVALTLVRLPLTFAYARSLLRPLDDNPVPAEMEPRELDGAMALLAGFGRRYLPVHALGWLVVLLSTTGFAASGVLGSITIGPTETLVAGFLLVLLPSVVLIVVSPELRAALRPYQDRLADGLLARGGALERGSGTLRTQLDAALLGYTLVIGMAIGLVGVTVNGQNVRELELERQRGAAELGAALVDHGDEDGLAAELELIEEAHALGPGLVEQLPSEGTITVIEPAASEVRVAAPTADGRWVVARGEPDERVGQTALILFALAFVIAMRGRSVARAVAESQTKPLDDLALAMREVWGADADADSQLVTSRDDEIGRLIVEFNELLMVIRDFSQAAAAVAEGDLRANLDEGGPLYGALEAMLERLRDVVARLRQTAGELGQTAASLHAATTQQQHIAELQASRAEALNATVDSLVGSARDINRAAERVLANAENTAARTDEGSARIAELGAATEAITALLAEIREIADRSDILALNGSLEATRAGEAGRGFALVAAEMRRLAERVNTTVSDATKRLAEVEQARGRAVESNAASRALAESTATAARDITELIGRQAHDTDLAAQAVGAAATEVNESVAGLAEVHAITSTLREEAEELTRLAETFEL